MNNTTSYIYLIQDGEYINTDVYKVGRTTQNGDTRSLNRLRCYSANTVQCYVRDVDTAKVVEIEKDIISVFKLKYNLVKGAEWFDGNTQQMIGDIDTIINKKVVLEQIDTVSKEGNDTKDTKSSGIIEDLENGKKAERYICKRCGIDFDEKRCLVQHLHRKRMCMSIESDVSPSQLLEEITNKKDVKCVRCNRFYKNMNTLGAHNCKNREISNTSKK